MKKPLLAFPMTLMALLLCGCGGGGGGGGGGGNPPGPSTSAPAFTYTTSNIEIMRTDQAFTLTPVSVGGAVTSWSVSPALPAGVSLDASTGVISFAAGVQAYRTTYEIRGTNAGGTGTFPITIQIAALPARVNYARNDYVLKTGVPVHIMVGSFGGEVIRWGLEGTLPAGLTFDSATGNISGTPTQVTAAADHVLTGSNPGGYNQFAFSLAVVDGTPDPHVLLDLGHGGGVGFIEHDGSRILSLGGGTSGHGTVALWNATTGAKLLSTTTDCPYGISCPDTILALVGPTAFVRTLGGFELFSKADGTLLASVGATGGLFGPSPNWATPASDGSYVAVGDPRGLTVYSTTGTVLFHRGGNHGSAKVFAAPGQLRIAGGPAGASVVETLALPAGTSTISTPFTGTAHSWFRDGERFFTTAGNTLAIYSKSVVREELEVLPSFENLRGEGEWFWTHGFSNTTLRIYKLGGGGTPAASYPLGVGVSVRIMPSHGAIAFADSGVDQISVIDLGGSTPVRHDYTTPVADVGAFGAASASDWAFGVGHGALFGELGAGAPQRYALGEARAIAGSDSRFAVAVASGSIFYFSAATHAQQGEIDFASAHLQLSADGNLLATSSEDDHVTTPDRSLKVLQLPAETEAASWAFPYPTDILSSFVFSRSGTTIGRSHGNPLVREVTLLDGTPIWSSNSGADMLLSPSGGLIAQSNGGRTLGTGTNIYLNGTLTAAVDGYAVAWLDDSRLLINRFGNRGYVSSSVVDASGQVLAADIPLPNPAFEVQPVSVNSAYFVVDNAIYDLTTGAKIWSSTAPHGYAGAVAGANVVFLSDSSVRIEPR